MTDFRDHRLDLATRVELLLGQLTLAEKLAMLHQYQPAIDRLGLSRFTTGTEALHGLAWLGEATVFPQAVGLGATWNVDLVRAIGDAVGDEVRGLHHEDQARCGLNVWAPVVNPLRDPRWGRNEEGYSEDVLLTAVMGEAYSWGLRGNHPQYLKTAPTLKHFLGYNNETDRCTSSSNLTPRVLHEYELPAFRRAISSGAAVAVMASYNLVNGRPAHVTPHINEDLRSWTSDEIFVVSDAYAPSNLADPAQQAFYPDHATSHAAALRAGIDSFTDQDNRCEVTIGRLQEALARNLITVSDVDSAVRRALTIRFRLGEFDPVAENPYAAISPAVVNSPAHQQLALDAARQSIVLLKAECQLLPLNPAVHKTIAVLGQLADHNHLDWYSGRFPYASTIRDGLTDAFGTVLHAEGVDRIALRHGEKYLTVDVTGAHLTDEPGAFDIFDWGNGVLTLRSTATEKFLHVSPEGLLGATSEGPSEWIVREMFRLDLQPDGTVHLVHHTSPGNPSTGSLQQDLSMGMQGAPFQVELLIDGTAQAAALAARADVAIVVAGNHPLINGRETEDRANLALPQRQDELARAVFTANQSTVLLIVSSYPYAAGWAGLHLPAVLWSSHGGQELGNAVAEVLTGKADPGGRLPQTWYRNDWELPDILDYDIIANDATYLYYRGTPLYPFGHGLSYTTFEYSQLSLSADFAGAGDCVNVSLVVTNTGPRHGTEVVQLYTHQQQSRAKQPLRQLRAFAKLSLAPGQSREVVLPLAIDDLVFWDVTTGGAVLETARHKVMAGRSCTDIRLTKTLSVRGTVIGTRKAVEQTIHACDNDEYSCVEPTDTGLRSVEDGAWLLFQGVDLSAANTAHIRGHGGPVEVRADDPFAGPLLAAAQAGSALPVTTLDGVHDLYLVMQSAGTTVRQLGFTP